MADEKAKPEHKPQDGPKLNAMGLPEPDTEQPVAPYHPDKPVGERQDGAGAAPPRADRHDALAPGHTAQQRREGPSQGHPEEPDADHRGQPAGLTSGAATGSGSGAGGGGTGLTEEPDPDSKGGGGREQGFAHARDLHDSHGDGRKHGGR